jgi:hypothetical protein
MFGSPSQGKEVTFPEDCLQATVGGGNWWIKDENSRVSAGSLAFAFAPHVDQLPYAFVPVGRKDPTVHESAIVKVAPLKVDQPLERSDLPVAAMSLREGEVWAAYRAKKRPCLVIGCDHPAVDATLTRGMPKIATAPTMLVAPYYGVTRNLQRAGYRPEFVERVRHCEYPQYVWDNLPFAGGEESILRLDHLQPIGAHYAACKPSGYRLSETAMGVIRELLQWLIWGGVPEDSLVALYRQEIESLLGR